MLIDLGLWVPYAIRNFMKVFFSSNIQIFADTLPFLAWKLFRKQKALINVIFPLSPATVLKQLSIKFGEKYSYKKIITKRSSAFVINLST